MTEEEWFAASGGEIRRRVGVLSPRRQRLLAVAVCCVLCETIDYPGVRVALEAAETFAETGKTKAALRRGRQAVEEERVALFESDHPDALNGGGIALALFAVKVAASENVVAFTVLHAINGLTFMHGLSDEGARRCVFPTFRDIIGPTPIPSFVPAWRTDTAVLLARQMYESRDFGAMPILADALQDAGCDNPDILTHCRDAKQTHVRGCWVIDLVLGKA